jgi:hypothetical protein
VWERGCCTGRWRRTDWRTRGCEEEEVRLCSRGHSFIHIQMYKTY